MSIITDTCDDEDETLLCCNNSPLTDPNFEDNWGLCHKIEENEEEDDSEEQEEEDV